MASAPTYDRVPAPEPPDSSDAWYAPDVRSQTTVAGGVVATVRETAVGFRYEVREPVLGAREERALERVRDHFDRESRRRPLTRDGTRERAAAGFAPKYGRALDRLLTVSPSARRRVDYHALAELRLLGAATPLALDERVEVVDLGRDDEDGVVVHTADYAPCRTALSAETPHVDRVAGERLAAYEVGFDEFSVPVVIYRDHLLGGDHFEANYAVLEPDLLPGDEALVQECKERVWEANVSEVVDDRALGVRTAVDDRGAVQRQRVEQAERQRQRGAALAAGELREQGVEAGVGRDVVGTRGLDTETGRTDSRSLVVGRVGREVGGDAEGDGLCVADPTDH